MARSATSSPASTAATCADGAVLRARRHRRPARTGSSGGCGSARCWRSARGGWCACSTRWSGARAAPATWPAGCCTCSTRTSSPTWGARRSRCWPRRRCRGCCWRAPRPARPRGWWWPAAFALVLTSTGGGVNVAVTAWLLLGPGAAGGLRAAAGARVASAAARVRACGSCRWWRSASPVVGRRRSSSTPRYGLDFLRYTEQPGTIWSTHVAARVAAAAWLLDELHRRRLHGDAARLFRPTPASLPGLCAGRAWRRWPSRHCAWASFAWTRARYAPFFLALVVSPGLLVMTFVGFPEGAPLRRAATLHLQPRAGRPLPAHVRTRRGRSCRSASPGLGALGACTHCARACAPRRSSPRGGAARRSRAGRSRAAVGLDRQLGLPDGVPAAWRDAAHDLDRTLPRGRRAMVLPGQLFALLRLGRHLRTRSCPALTDRPVAVRFIVPFADLQRRRPAVDDRRAGQPAARRARAAAAAARPRSASARSLQGPTTTARAAARSRLLGGRRACAGSASRARLRPAAHGPGRGGDARAGGAPRRRSAAGTCATGGMVRVLPRDDARPWSTARRQAHRRPRGLRRAADRPARCATPPTSTMAALRAQARAQRVVRDQRLQPPARLRRRPPARQHGLDACPPARSSPRTPRSWTRSRAAGPTRRPWRSCGGGALGPRRLLARLRPVPRAPAVRGARRRPARRRGWPTARWPPIATTSTWTSRRRATSTTST